MTGHNASCWLCVFARLKVPDEKVLGLGQWGRGSSGLGSPRLQPPKQSHIPRRHTVASGGPRGAGMSSMSRVGKAAHGTF